MNIEIINTGTELMLGRILNTHQQWLCSQLSLAGYTVTRQVTVADTGVEIQQAVKESLSRAELVITTGGLGPTSDDLTRTCIAELLGRKTHEDASVLAAIGGFYRQFQRAMPPTTAIQAQVPDGAVVLPNANGTAPGLALEIDRNPFHPTQTRSWLIMLPGPPRELRPMFKDQVLPLIKNQFPHPAPHSGCIFLVACLGESVIEERIAPLLHPLLAQGMDIAYCARVGEVEVRLTAIGPNAENLVQQGRTIVKAQLNHAIFSETEGTLEKFVVEELIRRKQTIATAESCTGGLIGHRITNISGASSVFLNGWITYSNESKVQLLGVPQATIDQHGAVSAETAMASGARQKSGADLAVTTTGIAGPTGGTPTKPVGTVFLGLSTPAKCVAIPCFFPFDRESFKSATSQKALDLIRRTLFGLPL